MKQKKNTNSKSNSVSSASLCRRCDVHITQHSLTLKLKHITCYIHYINDTQSNIIMIENVTFSIIFKTFITRSHFNFFLDFSSFSFAFIEFIVAYMTNTVLTLAARRPASIHLYAVVHTISLSAHRCVRAKR